MRPFQIPALNRRLFQKDRVHVIKRIFSHESSRVKLDTTFPNDFNFILHTTIRFWTPIIVYKIWEENSLKPPLIEIPQDVTDVVLGSTEVWQAYNLLSPWN